jgi:hypothetical protein
VRIKSIDDLSKLGSNAKKQIKAALKQQGGFNNQKRASDVDAFGAERKSKLSKHAKTDTNDTPPAKKKAKPARVMRTHEGLTYCPWPSTDPFVAVIQRLESKYGRYDEGGMLLTELILEGGTKQWRFDIALISPLHRLNVAGRNMWCGYTCLVEADGFGYHRSKDAFKNDRAKQTHALKQGFAVKRITNEDARTRLDEVMADIDTILSQPRLYAKNYRISPKGKTQTLLCWVSSDNEG